MLTRLKDLQWNPREKCAAESRHKLPELGSGGAPSDEVGLRVYTPTQIEISARSVRGGFVMVNDQYDPDWTAQVNGHDAELLRADYIMRAVQVPPGDST